MRQPPYYIKEFFLFTYLNLEKIRKSVYSILRQEQWEQQPHRKQDMER